jgi:hypothetical protein
MFCVFPGFFPVASLPKQLRKYSEILHIKVFLLLLKNPI